MKNTFKKFINKFPVTALTTTLFTYGIPEFVKAQEVNLETYCQRFHSDLLCKGYHPLSQRQENTYKNEVNQTIAFNLKTSGNDDEWIRIQTNENNTGGMLLKAYHTKQVKREFLSNVVTSGITLGGDELFRSALNGYDGPTPVSLLVPSINFHAWSDHKTTRIVFVPDNCPDNQSVPPSNGQQPQRKSCYFTGNDTLVLPQIDIRAGFFTIEYQEKELVRTVTFRLPPKKS